MSSKELPVMKRIFNFQRKKNQPFRSIRDLLLFGLAGALIYDTIAYYDLFEKLAFFFQRYESYELDEVFLLICILSICSLIYSQYRWLDYKAEVKRRQKNEKSLLLAQQKLRNLTARIENIREEERRWLALELNEDIAQTLATIKLDIEREIMYTGGDDFSGKKLHVDYLKDILEKLQNITYRVRPDALDHLNFLETVFWLSNDFQERTGIKCRFELACETITLAEDAAYKLYRILEEIFSNIEKHSLADQAVLKIQIDDKQLHIIVEDNGCGIRQDQMISVGAAGMMYMQEKIYRLDGSMNIVGAPGSGTFISIKVPLDSEGEAKMNAPIVYEDSLL